MLLGMYCSRAVKHEDARPMFCVLCFDFSLLLEGNRAVKVNEILIRRQKYRRDDFGCSAQRAETTGMGGERSGPINRAERCQLGTFE